MTSPKDDYSRYFPASPEIRHWGLGLTGAGFAHITPGSSYPPSCHPPDHHFEWRHGRILDNLQILLITRGRGELETTATGQLRVEAGMAFLLLPGVWHRYRPEPATGWDENWVEMTGPVVSGLVESGIYSPSAILKAGAVDLEMDEPFETIHRSMRKPAAGFQPELSAAALRLLALFARPNPGSTRQTRISTAVQKAEQYLADHQAEPVNIEALARRLGVAYSHFRRAFRAQTGFAPWQYVIQLRLARSRRMLASSDATLQEVAERTGFSSAFHLSLAFKRAYGQSPLHWKKTLAAPLARR